MDTCLSCVALGAVVSPRAGPRVCGGRAKVWALICLSGGLLSAMALSGSALAGSGLRVLQLSDSTGRPITEGRSWAAPGRVEPGLLAADGRSRWLSGTAAQMTLRQTRLLGSLNVQAPSGWTRWAGAEPDLMGWRWRHLVEQPLRVALDGSRWDLLWRMEVVDAGQGAPVSRYLSFGLAATAPGWWRGAVDRLEFGVYRHEGPGGWRGASHADRAARESSRDWGIALAYGTRLSETWSVGADVQWSGRSGFSLIRDDKVSFGLRAQLRF